MWSYALKRCLLMVPTLLGITLVTFLLLDLSPVDRATIELARARSEGTLQDRDAREWALARLRLHYGLVDPATGEERPVLARYGQWLGNALRFELAGPDQDPAEFRRRIGAALPVSVMLGSLCLLLAFVVGVPLGAWLGRRRGSGADRGVSVVTLVLLGVPEFLLATLLLLAFGTAGLGLLPVVGLQGDGMAGAPLGQRLVDLGQHLLLPVLALAIGPLVLVTRFVREAVARAAEQPFAQNLRAWGLGPRREGRRLLRHALSPLATLLGGLLPAVVAGSVVVETVFTIDGLGRLAWQAVRGQDQAMVMAVTLLGAVATLLALLVSDLAQRVVDPRVRLER